VVIFFISNCCATPLFFLLLPAGCAGTCDLVFAFGAGCKAGYGDFRKQNKKFCLTLKQEQKSGIIQPHKNKRPISMLTSEI
jgi:hypothetical protein